MVTAGVAAYVAGRRRPNMTTNKGLLYTDAQRCIGEGCSCASAVWRKRVSNAYAVRHPVQVCTGRRG